MDDGAKSGMLTNSVLLVEKVQPAVSFGPQLAMETHAKNPDQESHTPLTRKDGLDELTFEVKHGPVDVPTAIFVENEPLASVGQETEIRKRNYIPYQNASSPDRPEGVCLPAPVLYVSITLERTVETTSWGLGMIKENAGIAFVVCVGPPTKDGPRVTCCRISNSVTTPSSMQYNKTRCLGGAGLSVHRLIPGDAIISIDGIPMSSFPNIDLFLAYTRNSKKMEIVALRHSIVWSTAQAEVSLSSTWQGHLVYTLEMKKRVAMSIREVWMRILAFISDDQYSKCPDSASWYQHYKELTRLFQIHDNLEVSSFDVFRRWIKDQSCIFQRFLRHTLGMTELQIGMLNSTSFDWNSNLSNQGKEDSSHHRENANQGR